MNVKVLQILKKYREYKQEFPWEITTSLRFTPSTWFNLADDILNVVPISELLLETKYDDVVELQFLRYKKVKHKEISSNCYLDEKYIEVPLKNIKKLELYSYYPTLIEYLFDNGIMKLPKDLNKYYIVFKYIFNLRKEYKNYENYDENINYIIKLIINFFYGILNNKFDKLYNEKNNENFEIFKSKIFNDIKSNLGYKLIYFDTCTYYYFDHELPLIKLLDDISERVDVDNFIIFKKKKYIEHIGNDFKIKGRWKKVD